MPTRDVCNIEGSAFAIYCPFGDCNDHNASYNPYFGESLYGMGCYCNIVSEPIDWENGGTYAPAGLVFTKLLKFGCDPAVGCNEVFEGETLDYQIQVYESNGQWPCNSGLDTNTDCNNSVIESIDPDGEGFFVTLRSTSALTVAITNSNESGESCNGMWIEKWCRGDEFSADCVSSSNNAQFDFVDICPDPIWLSLIHI